MYKVQKFSDKVDAIDVKRAKYIIQEVNLYKDKEFLGIPDEKEMDDYMTQLGFTNNEVIAKHDGVDQIDKIYYKG